MSKSLFIIGNGFDLSHGLKTDYSSFIRDLLDKESAKPGEHKSLFQFVSRSVVTCQSANRPSEIEGYNQRICFNHNFFGHLIREFNSKKWCDIETAYYNNLKGTSDPKGLNDCFDIIKKKLEEYLFHQIIYQSRIESYDYFFRMFRYSENFILNFNYTPTVKRLYKNETKGFKQVNIHGQLFSDSNPMIFGFSPSYQETKDLLDKNNVEYLRNLKAYNYKRNNFSAEIDRFFEQHSVIGNGVKVFIMGQSCSLSDKRILQNILNNENVVDIHILYHNTYENYFNMLTNVHRIMDSNENYDKIRSFDDSLRMPQIDDSAATVDEFRYKLDKIFSNDT